jgi:ubiquinone/menaquinone biosynthesis C-methylase UbiE
MSEQSYYEAESLWNVARYVTPEESQRFDQVAAMIPADAASLLDVGAGNGVFLSRVRDRRPIRCGGLERSASAREVAQRDLGIELTAGDIADLPFPARSWDVLSSLQVMEHLPTPVFDRAREEMARVASRYVIVNVPFREHRTFNRCPECGTRFPDYYHVRRFNQKAMATLIPGFALCRTETTSKVSRSLVSILYELSWKKIRGTFSTIARCPLCGHTRTDRTVSGSERNSAAPSATGNRVKRLLRWPSLPWYREVICLYERTDQ